MNGILPRFAHVCGLFRCRELPDRVRYLWPRKAPQAPVRVSRCLKSSKTVKRHPWRNTFWEGAVG